jgi:rubrerythrin
MKTAFEMGTNRTGIALSPIDGPLAIEGATQDVVPPPGDASALDVVRQDQARAAEPIGSLPPPATVKGAVKTAVSALQGEKANVLIDKIAERLGFERGGTRLYQLLVSKSEVYNSWKGGPTRARLLEIQSEELRHTELLRDALLSLGADPTSLTPSADIASNLAVGIRQVMADPRTNLLQCLEAALVAELSDNACWENLVELARELGQDKLAAQFDAALQNEQEHLVSVKTWVRNGLSEAANARMPELKQSADATSP